MNILFHGIGGCHLAVSVEAHEEILNFFSKNKKKYYADSYINIMKNESEWNEEKADYSVNLYILPKGHTNNRPTFDNCLR